VTRGHMTTSGSSKWHANQEEDTIPSTQTQQQEEQATSNKQQHVGWRRFNNTQIARVTTRIPLVQQINFIEPSFVTTSNNEYTGPQKAGKYQSLICEHPCQTNSTRH
jgi:hypothetical protein